MSPDIQSSLLRPLFFGVITLAMVYGIANLQIYRYFVCYRKDTTLEKISVASLCFLLVVYMSVALYAVYYTLVVAWNSPLQLLQPAALIISKLTIFCDVFIVNCVHALYALKAWKLGSNMHYMFRSTIVVIIAAEYGVSMFAVIQMYRWESFLDIGRYKLFWHTAIYGIFLSATCADLVLALLISYALRQSITEFSHTNSKISTLLKYTVASGLLTGLLDLAALVTHAALPTSFIFHGLALPLPSLYVNSYVALLNTRRPHSTAEPNANTSIPQAIKSSTSISGRTNTFVHLPQSRR